MTDLLHCFGGTRYVILVLSTLVLTFVIGNATVFNFAIICMQNSTNSQDDSWLSSPGKLNSLFASPAIGSFLFTLPLTFFIGKFGIRYTLVAYCSMTALSTILFPMAVQSGYVAVFFARFLQGIPTALSFPATGQIAAQWTTAKGGATFISILTSHMQIAGIMAMMVTASFCDSSFGWEGSFYFHGVVSAILFIVFLFYYRDDPKNHKNVSSEELDNIMEGKCITHVEEKVPYMEIFTDPCVWSIWISMFGCLSGLMVFIIYGPIYVNKIVGLDVSATGMATAVPNIIALVLKFVLGPLSDKANCVSQRFRMIMFATVSQLIAAAFMIIMAYTDNKILALIGFTAVNVFGGLNAVGTIKCAQMVYGNHVHFVMMVVSIMFGIIGPVLPFAIGAIVPEHTRAQWDLLLQISAVVVSVTSIPFIFFAREEPLSIRKKTVDAEEQMNLRQNAM